MNNINYNRKKWKLKRNYILSRDDFECQESRRYGKTIKANTVHHIYPVEDYPGLMWEDWNLLSVTERVHNTFHDRNTNAITDKGLFWQRRFKRQFKRWEENEELLTNNSSDSCNSSINTN